MFKPEDKDEEVETKAWGNFQVHSNEASLKKAEDDFFDRVSNGASPTPSIYPDYWKPSDVEDNIVYAKTIVKLGHRGVAKALQLIDKDDNDYTVITHTSDGKVVNLKLVLSTLLDIPEAMVKF